jgi:hypothetical protein
LVLAVAIAVGVAACGAIIRVPETPASPEQLTEFWIDPGDLQRDLLWGVGGEEHAPPANAVYEFKAKDTGGFSTSYDVVAPDGTAWGVKIGVEAQPEVVVSRILWGLGYHQPPIYYLPSWKFAAPGRAVQTEKEGRFRPKLQSMERLDEYWRWSDNPYVGRPELSGLLVVLLMLNSTDLKDDNNSIYQLAEPWDGARRWFVVRDLGASLGETGKWYPHRNWLEGFENRGFIKRVRGDRIEFDFRGRHQELLTLIRPADVRWAAMRMARFSDSQWQDSFRAGGYSDIIAARYIRRIKRKIDDGLAVQNAPRLAKAR